MDFQPSNQLLPPPNTSELSTINPECYSDVEKALDCGGQSRGEYSSVDGTMEEIHAMNGATERGVMEAWATTFKREELKSTTMA